MDADVNKDDKEKEKEKLILENTRLYKEAKTEWDEAITEWNEDIDFYVGDQWTAAAKEKLERENRPALCINNIKKSCDIVTGHAEQNCADIHVFPIESSDTTVSEIYSEVIKWTLDAEGNKFYIPYAFKSAVHVGLGWLALDVKFDHDIVDGDVFIRRANPFHIIADPNFTEPDLSDCQYIFRYSYLDKAELKSRYPELKDDIGKLEDRQPSESDETTKNMKYRGKKVIVKERWYRSYETRKVIVTDGEVQDVTDAGAVKLAALKLMGKKVISRQVGTIRMCSTANDKLLLFDGPSPLGIDKFPFIPIFGWYTPDHNDWKYRVQGMVRILKDSQREKNKRRSQLMSMSLAHFGGYFYEPGTFRDIKQFTNSQGGFMLVEKNADKKLEAIQPPQMSAALVQLEQFHSQDMKEIGPNPDLLGQMMSKSEPGMNIQMRQKQGMLAIEDLFTNLSFAKRLLGKVLIEIINTYEPEKIERIIGRKLPENWEQIKRSARLDTAVDEIADSPSYRMGLFESYKNLQQQGIPVPPEVMLSVTEMPKADKEKIKPLLDLRNEVEMSNLKLQKLQIDFQMKQIEMQIEQANNPPPPQIPDQTGQEGGQLPPEAQAPMVEEEPVEEIIDPGMEQDPMA